MLRLETKSARSRNMDAEEINGTFSVAKHKAVSATIYFLPCKMRAQKNRTVAHLDGLEKENKYSHASYSNRRETKIQEKNEAE